MGSFPRGDCRDKRASVGKGSRGLALTDHRETIVALRPYRERRGQNLPQVGLVELAAVNQVPRELSLHKAMIPLIAISRRANSRTDQGSDRRLKARIIGAVRDIIVASGGELAFRTRETLLCLSDVDVTLVYHDAIIRA